MSSSAQYSCPHCQKLFEAALVDQPQTVACPHCGQATLVEPAPAVTSPAAPPSPLAHRPTRRRSSYFGWLLALLVLVAAGTFLAFSRRLPFFQKTDQSSNGPLTSDDTDDGGSAASNRWTDAENTSLRLAGFEVKIVRAELGPVLGRDAGNTVQTLATDGLQIGLQIRNVSEQPQTYKSWYAESREGESYVELRDSLDNFYPLLYFTGVSQMRGHTAEAAIEPSQRIEDTLVFEIKPEVDRNRVTHFHLRLEASPLNSGGRFQFRIPVSMVHNWQ